MLWIGRLNIFCVQNSVLKNIIRVNSFLVRKKIYIFQKSSFSLSRTMDSSKEDIKVQWNLSVENIKSKVQELIEKTRSVYDYVGSIPSEEVNLENVLMTLAYNDYKHRIENSMLDFPQHVSTNKEIRSASTEADKMLSDFAVEMSMREDVFKNLITLQNKNCTMSKEAARYLERLIRNGQRDGLHLSKDTQEEVKRIKKRISDLSIEFNKNCNEENTIFEFTEDELSGLPQDFLNGLKKTENGDKFQVSLKYPDYFPCMKNARNPDVRKILETGFNSRRHLFVLGSFPSRNQRAKLTSKEAAGRRLKRWQQALL